MTGLGQEKVLLIAAEKIVEGGKTKVAEKRRSPKKSLLECRAFPPLLFPLFCHALSSCFADF